MAHGIVEEERELRHDRDVLAQAGERLLDLALTDDYQAGLTWVGPEALGQIAAR